MVIFDLAFAAVLVGVFLLGSTLPWFSQPNFIVTCGNDERYRRQRTAEPPDIATWNALGHTGTPKCFATLLKVRETRRRWADDVSVEVVEVKPPRRADRDLWEFLPWWSVQTPSESTSFPPGRSRWVVFNTVMGDGNKPVSHTAIADCDPVEVTLAVLWQGKVMSGVRLKIEGHCDPTKYHPDVAVIDRPKRRRLAKLRDNRSPGGWGFLRC